MNKEFLAYIHDNTNLEIIMDRLYPRAQDNRSWVCPVCGKGAKGKKKKDGIKMDTSRPGALHCFSASHNFDGDIINLICETDGVDNQEAERRLMEITGFIPTATDSTTATYTGTTVHTHRSNSQSQEVAQIRSEIHKDREKRISNAVSLEDTRLKPLIESARENLTDQRAVEYLQKRGISVETAKNNGVGYIKEPTYIGLSAKGKPMLASDCMIFTDNYSSFGSRFIEPKGDFKAIKPSKDKHGEPFEDIPYLLRNAILSKDKKLSDKIMAPEPIFLLEGQFDALSVIEVGGDAISLNGGGNTDKIIQIFKEYDIKRPLLVAMDNDDAGHKSGKRVYNELKDAGLDVFLIDLIPPDLEIDGLKIKDANDYLVKDRQGLRLAVNRARHIPTQAFENSFNSSQKQDFINGLGKRAQTPAIKTGFDVLDSQNFLDGGIFEGLIVVGAISSLGKTSYVYQLCNQIAANGHDVIFFSLEMSSSELHARGISRYTAMDVVNTTKPERYYPKTLREITDMKRWNGYTREEMQHLDNSINRYFEDTGSNMRIIEGVGNITTDIIREKIEEHIKYRGKAPLVAIDYIQLISQNSNRSMSDKQVMDATVLQLKQISRDFKIPIIAISSFNRDNYNNKVSMLSFKESGALEYGSDLLVGMERSKQPTKNGTSESAKKEYELALKKLEEEERRTGIREVRLKVLKNRNGQAGGSIILRYFYKYFYFQEVGDEYILNQKSFNEYDDADF